MEVLYWEILQDQDQYLELQMQIPSRILFDHTVLAYYVFSEGPTHLNWVGGEERLNISLFLCTKCLFGFLD